MNKNERFIINQVLSREIYSIDKSGKIWRHKKWINYKTGYIPCTPERVELVNGKYLEVHIKVFSKEYRAKAHRIVWIYFHGDIDNKLQINHKDGNGKNNHPNNLELVTQSENTIHAYKNGLAHGRPKELHHNAMLTEKDVNDIRKKYSTGKYSQSILGELFGVSQGQIGKIIRKERWR